MGKHAWFGGGFCVLAVDGSPLFGVIRVCMHTWVYIDEHTLLREFLRTCDLIIN